VPGPLEGIKVVDLSAIISGPMCCQMLADQGAEVIKVEPRGIGDLTRVGGFRVGTVSSLFINVNRGKASVAIDLSGEEGLAVLRRLVADADVVVQNFRPGAAERMGIGPDDLLAVNPDLVYVSISGFGPTGPYRDWRVYDPVIQAVSGVVSIQQSQDLPFPDLVRTILCDKATAQTAAQAITAALFARATGKARGQHLVVPMLDAALYWLWPDVFMAHTMTGPSVVPGPTLYQVYRLQPTADGQLVYFMASDAEFQGLSRALGHPEWIDDERFDTPVKRQVPEHFAALGALIEAAFATVTTDEVMARLHAEQVPAARVNTLDDVFDDPQVVHNDVVHTWTDPVVGPVRQARPPVRWSHTAHEPVWAIDQLGASTEAVLRAHGYDDDALAALRAAGVIG
jgi:crotonobetainyl-CoA:carnitine CoA-transferase CaiB-like acyl-CoA transferase